MIVPFEAHDDPDIDDVWKWFEYQIALIGESRAHILRLLGSGPSLASQVTRLLEDQFLGLTKREVAEFFDAQTGQLERLTMFEILATTEAVLRLDFITRVAARKKDALSRRYRELHKIRVDKIRLDEDILVSMKEESCVGKCNRRVSGSAETTPLARAWEVLASKTRSRLCAKRYLRYLLGID